MAKSRAIRAVSAKRLPALAVWQPVQVVGQGDRAIARVAAAQRRQVMREQLFAAGIGRGAIAHRLKNGRLHHRYPGVYRVGPDTGEPWADETAVILYFGGQAVLSHASAAALWGLKSPPPPHVVVTTIGHGARSRPGLVVHRTTRVDRSDVRRRDGLPVTSPARTLIDLASEADGDDLEEALAIARMTRLASDREIERALAHAPHRPGVARLMRLLDTGGEGFTRTRAERRMQALVRQAGLPAPLVNVQLHGFTVDFLWADSKLVVEVDGYEFHADRKAFEHDRRRDQILVAAGYRVIRITWRQLRDEPLAVIVRIAQALTAAAA
jgi:very-short-patch-repair endonuclease